MARKVKDNPRAAGDNMNLFVAHDGALIDSSNWAVIHHGLDTVRQLYAGLIDMSVYLAIQSAYDQGFNTTVEVGGFDWIVSTGGRSGYRFTLRNPNVGLTILVGSSFLEPKYNGHHLKIQASPVFLLSRSIDDIQSDLDHFASFFINQVKHTGVALHICADVQGWIPPVDLDRRITTRAKRIFKYSSIEKLEFDFNEVALVYGKGTSFTWGSRASLEFNLYDKTLAVKAKGELPLWLPVWAQSSDYDENAPIQRFELRFHQSVIDQFANGSGFVASKLSDLEPHINGLWRYGMDNFRLDDTKTYINPFWQWLRDDLTFYHRQVLDIDYKRLYQAPGDDGVPSDRAISICFGQLAAIYGRNGYDIKKASQCLVNSGIWQNLVGMYLKRGKEVEDIYLALDDKLSRFKKAA